MFEYELAAMSVIGKYSNSGGDLGLMEDRFMMQCD